MLACKSILAKWLSTSTCKIKASRTWTVEECWTVFPFESRFATRVPLNRWGSKVNIIASTFPENIETEIFKSHLLASICASETHTFNIIIKTKHCSLHWKFIQRDLLYYVDRICCCIFLLFFCEFCELYVKKMNAETQKAQIVC